MGEITVQHVKTINPIVIVDGVPIKYKGIASTSMEDEHLLIFDIDKERFVIKSDNKEFINALESYALTEQTFNIEDLSYFFGNIFDVSKHPHLSYEYETVMSYEVEPTTYVKVLSSTTYYPYCNHKGEYVKTFYVQAYDRTGHSQPFTFYCKKFTNKVNKPEVLQLDISIERILYLLSRIEGINDIVIRDFYDYFCGLGDCPWFYNTYERTIIRDRNSLTRGSKRSTNYTIFPNADNQLIVSGSLAEVLNNVVQETVCSSDQCTIYPEGVGEWLNNLMEHVTVLHQAINDIETFGSKLDNRDLLYSRLTSITALTVKFSQQLLENETRKRVLDV